MTAAMSLATAPYRTRLSILFARTAPKAVILRRGPRTHWCLIDWDLATDTFTPGQWMKGQVSLCDLSPDGRKLIYFASQYHKPKERRTRVPTGAYEPLSAPAAKTLKRGRKVPRYLRGGSAHGPERPRVARLDDTWTAISTPPFFSALALWPAFGCWTGGGFFQSNRDVYIGEPDDRMTPVEHVRIPQGLHVYSYRSVDTETLGALFIRSRPQAPPAKQTEQQRAALEAAGARWVDFVVPRSDDELVFACDGCLFRLRGWQRAAPERYLATATRIADFRDMTFAPVEPPPWAMRW